MRILNLSLGQDTGGQQGRLQDAWPEHFPDDEYLSVTSTKTFYPIKNKLNLNELIRHQWPWAEVIHMNNDLRYIQRFRPLQAKGKALVIHHHGTMFRTRPEYHLEAMRAFRAVGMASTVDLYAIAPDKLIWMPQAYQLSELQPYRQPIDDGILRIAHAPTNRAIKGTMALEKAVRRLKAKGVKIELQIIERKPNALCLQLKGKADVYVDQMLLGYGCNAVEAWGMGIPVIAGVDPEGCAQRIKQVIPMDTEDRMLQLWGRLPFYKSTEDGLYAALSHMLEPTVRSYWSRRGMQHFMRWHEAGAATSRLRQVYETAVQITEQVAEGQALSLPA